MNDEMVMRSVYLGLTEDSRLRQVAFEVGLNKSILIRSAIQKALNEWSRLSHEEIRQNVEASRQLPTGREAGDEPAAVPSRSGADQIADGPSEPLAEAVETPEVEGVGGG